MTPTIADRDFTIATLQGSRAVLTPESDEVEEAPETEVIKQKSEDED